MKEKLYLLFRAFRVIWVVSKLGSLLGTLNSRCRIILRTQKGTIILTTTHIQVGYPKPRLGVH